MDGDSRQLALLALIGCWQAEAEWTELSCSGRACKWAMAIFRKTNGSLITL